MTSAALVDGYDAVFVDLDGVVFQGDQSIPGAARTLDQVRAAGHSLAFITNNASRTPAQVAEHLRSLAVNAQETEVVTAAMAAAQRLAEEVPPAAPVLVVGGDGIVTALRSCGLSPVDSAGDAPVAVVQGWAPTITWSMLAEAAVAIRGGARWIATNLDMTLPSPRGPLPGNGSMVAALAAATGQEPRSIGKPEPALFQTARVTTGAQRPIMVGDRLDTDIAGARAAGIDSLAVLSGVTDARRLLAAGESERPTYLACDISGLLEAPVTPRDSSDIGVLWRTCLEAWSGTVTVEQAEEAIARLDLD